MHSSCVSRGWEPRRRKQIGRKLGNIYADSTSLMISIIEYTEKPMQSMIARIGKSRKGEPQKEHVFLGEKWLIVHPEYEAKAEDWDQARTSDHNSECLVHDNRSEECGCQIPLHRTTCTPWMKCVEDESSISGKWERSRGGWGCLVSHLAPFWSQPPLLESRKIFPHVPVQL